MHIPVVDPFGVENDSKMPFLAQALDPVAVERHLAFLGGSQGRVKLQAIRVIRHKAGRRCLIEYDVAVKQLSGPLEALTIIGKARARGLDTFSFYLLASLWNVGFGADSADGISVPEPIGIIPDLHMWLQRKVPGVAATTLLAGSGGVALASRIAEAAHKLHCAGIPSLRRHTMADELRILHERLSVVAQMRPGWAERLRRILDACDRLGADTPEPCLQGIHRDFYPDQVIVDGVRLYLVDLDLYCEGDPGLDIGNFIGHLTEQSLRTLGDSDALADREAVLEARFVELAGEATHAAVRAYTILTLVRHISLSTQFPERRQYTEPLLELCEQRLGIVAYA